MVKKVATEPPTYGSSCFKTYSSDLTASHDAVGKKWSACHSTGVDLVAYRIGFKSTGMSMVEGLPLALRFHKLILLVTACMGVRKIFSRRAHKGIFPRYFYGGPKVVKFVFSTQNYKNNLFLF